MAVSRYELVRRRAEGKRVLEVACGSGQGLGYVRGSAAWIVGGDITHDLLAQAALHYRDEIPLLRFDAHALPFAPSSFDLIQIHEAIYYMAAPETVFRECRRVLRKDGLLVISTINSEWRDFNPSPFATTYLDAVTLRSRMKEVFSSVEILFGFPTPAKTVSSAIVSILKRAASRNGLIPSTMNGKTFLKRVFLGPLLTVPTEIPLGWATLDEPQRVPLDQSSEYRIIYAIARP